MINEGITFDASSGPIMSGTWRNPKTGDKFTVRDTFFQDNQFLIQTTDGRQLDYNMIQNYIKLEKESEEDGKMLDNIFNTKQQTENIPDEVKNLLETKEDDSQNNYSEYMIPEDTQILNKTTNIQSSNIINNEQLSEDDMFIKRALSSTILPETDINLNWAKYPHTKINMLINLLDIDPEKIAEWYINKMDLNYIKSQIKKSITYYINKAEEITQPTPKVESTPTKKQNKIRKTK